MGEGIRLGCSMIVRDEAARLPACVASGAGVVDEWVVYDTGSVDRTREVAADLGCRVVQGEWRDDFAWARNRSLEHATGDWILVLDADDRLTDGTELRAALREDPPADALFLRVTSEVRTAAGETGHQSCWQPRVFRATAGVRYRCPIHEAPILDGLRVGAAPGVVVHTGYVEPEARRAKAERALALLSRMPEDDTHRLYHTARARAVLADDAGVVDASERLAARQPVLPPDARCTWARSLLVLARPAEAIEVLVRGLRDDPHSPDLHHGLFLAGGFGFLATALDEVRSPGWFGGIRATSDRAAGVAAALVEQGLLDSSFLTDPSLAGLFPPGPRQRSADSTRPAEAGH